MNGKAILLLLSGAALGFAAAVIGTKSEVIAQPAVQKADMGRTPPEIKEGVKVRFEGSHISANVTGRAQSPTVVRVQGNWVYLKGEIFGSEKLDEAWVNFDTVGWYKVVIK